MLFFHCLCPMWCGEICWYYCWYPRPLNCCVAGVIPTMALTDLAIRRLKPSDKAYRTSDGGGLFIEVKPNGSKLWRMAYRFNGKQKLLSFGPYPEMPLARAREKRLEAKSLLTEGIDPMAHAKEIKERERREAEDSFGNIAEELLAKGAKEGLAEATLVKKRWLLSLMGQAFADRPIRDIAAPEILAQLREIEAKGNYETARKLRGFVGQVFRYAIATGRATSDPTYGLRGALIRPKTVHRAAFTNWDDFGGLVRAIWGYEAGSPETRIALKLLILLYSRPGELRLAKWGEFDLDKAIWTIPAERMKMRREHRKPLPKVAIKLLHELLELNNESDWVFPSALSPGMPISENTLNGALRRMGFTKDECSAHGFRASASSLLNESGKWSPDAIEAELAHMGADEVRRAYHRSLYWDERVQMADWWAKQILQNVEKRHA